jgi:Spy/CpxP family protein refolding chaperone
MRRYITILLIAIATISAFAADIKKMSDEDRQKWLIEMRNYKHDYITRELSLSRDQANKFFPIYDDMEDKLNKLGAETRDLERKVTSDTDASAVECESAARALFEQKKNEGEIELQYFEKFKEILTPRQLVNLKNVERKFVQQVVNYHGKARNRN